MHLLRSSAALVLLLTACPGGGSNASDTDNSSATGDDSATTAATSATASEPTTTPGSGSTAEIPTTTAPTSGPDESSGDPTGAPAEGCDGARLLAVPEDTSLPGPWPVGARTVEFSGLTIEVWYPATPGSQADLEPIQYDIRTSLPDTEQAKVPDDANP
ncbi:MAG: hypothetical protein JNK56_35320, partial [Myxococcales bacterium]|nr:hypothetical protein [Myxococcales bacterium]